MTDGDVVARYYDETTRLEWERLDRHRTEGAVTLRVLADHLPPPPARVADVGSGPGRYAVELARRGYDVTLVDLSAASLHVAARKAAAAGVVLAGTIHGSAVELPVDGPFDAVLLLGPLYHLLEREERLRALAEVRRVLVPGGVLFAAMISRFGVFRDLAGRNPHWLVEKPDYAERILTTGRGDRPTEFTNAYFARPEELAPLLDDAGFDVLEIVGCEGVVAGREHAVNELEGEAWDAWIELNLRIGRDPVGYVISDHLLAAARPR